MPTFPQIIIPQKQVGRNSDIYVTMVSYTTQVSLVTLLILQRNETLATKDSMVTHYYIPGGEQRLVRGNGGNNGGDGKPRGGDPARSQPAGAH